MARTPRFDGGTTHYTADLHLFHRNIPLYQRSSRLDADGNPFLTWHQDNETGEDIQQATEQDISNMHETMITNWNKQVAPGDTVFIVGDLAMGGKSKSESVVDIVDNRLNGRKISIPGNHDDYVLNLPFETLEWKAPLYEARVSGQLVVLCHYPLLVWNRNNRGAWNLHGHSHHSLPIDTRYKRLDVGIDGPWGFRPVSHTEVTEILSHHAQEALDHHY